MKFVDGDASCRSQEQQAPVARRKKIEGVHGKPGGGWAQNNRQDEHDNIDVDDAADELVTIAETFGQEIIPPPGPGIPQATVRTGRLVNADEPSTVRAQNRTSLLVSHRHSIRDCQCCSCATPWSGESSFNNHDFPLPQSQTSQHHDRGELQTASAWIWLRAEESLSIQRFEGNDALSISLHP